MIKIFKIFIYVCLTVIPIVWLSNYPGEVKILWKDYLVETNVMGLFTISIVFCIIIMFLFATYIKIKNFPRQYVLTQKEKNITLAQNSLTEISLALSKGDFIALEKNARKIKKQLDEHVFSTYLIAQASIQAKEYKKAEKYLNIIKKNKNAEFIAYKSLGLVSIKQNQEKLSLKYLKKAHSLDEKDLWVSEQLSLILAKAEKWSEALNILKFVDNVKSPNLFEKKAFYMLESGVDPFKYYDLSLASLPSVLKIIELNMRNLDEKKALDVITRTWEKYQYLGMIHRFFKQDSYDVKIALRRFKKIYKAIMHVETDETKLALAMSAFEAKLWGKAKSLLQSISDHDIDQRVVDLWKKLSKESNKIEIPNLPSKIQDAPKWSCSICLNESDNWKIKCIKCNSIGCIFWPKKKVISTNETTKKDFFLA